MSGDCEVLHDSDCEFVEPQTFSLSRKRGAIVVESQEDMSFDGAPAKAPCAFRIRIMPSSLPHPSPSTLLQSLLPSLEDIPRQMGDQDFGACEK